MAGETTGIVEGMATTVVALPGEDRASRPTARLLRRRLLVAAGVALVAGAAVFLLFVQTRLGQRFDMAAFDGAHQQAAAVRDAPVSQLQQITAYSFTVVLLVLVVIGAVRRRLWLGVAAALAAGVAVVGTDVAKTVLPRSDLIWGGSAANTFPSGHTATAVACAMALMLVSPPRWRGLAAVVAGAYAWITAAEVQTAGWHRPSDAVGGALVSFASVTLVGAVVARRHPVDVGRQRTHRLALGVLGLVALAAAAATAVTGVEVLRWFAAHPAVQPPSGILHDCYVTGLAGTVLLVVTLIATLLVLIGRHDLGSRPAYR